MTDGPLGPVHLARTLAAPDPGWTTRADVIVVGSGIAGLTAALELRTRVPRVLLVTKGQLWSGSTVWAQGGIAAALAPTDSPAAHLADTLAAGGGVCDPAAVEVLVTEGPDRLRELVARGATFDLDDGGQIALTREGGHGADRIAHAGGDATGAEISRALVAQLEAVRNDPGIEVIENALVLDVLTTDPHDDGASRACGVTLHVRGEGSRDGVGQALAGAVVLATGGIGQVFRSSTNPPQATADGLAAALRAGAELGDLEFVQFHPTVLWLGSAAQGQLPLISEAVRGEGAVLLDVDGVPFMQGVHPMADLAPRDVVAHAIVRRMAATGTDHVLLDARHLGADFLRRRFPTITARLADQGIDWTEVPVPVAPAQHYHSGGVVTDLDGRSTIDGLYAVGEVACTGVHGANRLASNSLLEGLVFAHRAAHAIADRVARGELRPGTPARRPGPSALVPAAARAKIQATAAAGPGVIRTDDGLRRAAARLAGVPTDAHLRHAGTSVLAAPQTAEWETTNLRQIAAALTAAALARTESRGGHYRADHPDLDPAWARRVTVALADDGELVVTAGADRAADATVLP
ncbi:L-aspartate oxidase [Paraoerskovia marina]|uniref:L-aspartate oxidase n=1 Tax=Paraoerskovia marina TaxID=545619 RepID=UPI000A8B7D47|nr:L-aspartate oxidase [Paraoerskovia marina]